MSKTGIFKHLSQDHTVQYDFKTAKTLQRAIVDFLKHSGAGSKKQGILSLQKKRPPLGPQAPNQVNPDNVTNVGFIIDAIKYIEEGQEYYKSSFTNLNNGQDLGNETQQIDQFANGVKQHYFDKILNPAQNPNFDINHTIFSVSPELVGVICDYLINKNQLTADQKTTITNAYNAIPPLRQHRLNLARFYLDNINRPEGMPANQRDPQADDYLYNQQLDVIANAFDHVVNNRPLNDTNLPILDYPYFFCLDRYTVEYLFDAIHPNHPDRDKAIKTMMDKVNEINPHMRDNRRTQKTADIANNSHYDYTFTDKHNKKRTVNVDISPEYNLYKKNLAQMPAHKKEWSKLSRTDKANAIKALKEVVLVFLQSRDDSLQNNKVLLKRFAEYSHLFGAKNLNKILPEALLAIKKDEDKKDPKPNEDITKLSERQMLVLQEKILTLKYAVSKYNHDINKVTEKGALKSAIKDVRKFFKGSFFTKKSNPYEFYVRKNPYFDNGTGYEKQDFTTIENNRFNPKYQRNMEYVKNHAYGPLFYVRNLLYYLIKAPDFAVSAVTGLLGKICRYFKFDHLADTIEKVGSIVGMPFDVIATMCHNTVAMIEYMAVIDGAVHVDNPISGMIDIATVYWEFIQLSSSEEYKNVKNSTHDDSLDKKTTTIEFDSKSSPPKKTKAESSSWRDDLRRRKANPIPEQNIPKP
ncbi:MAG: hypothetical protein BGO27_06850 [Alphaproteobacteria bacterium 33-17]|nr:MAG: hypothetical protein BGO27_06850 [Alphaproteobacteria bacterium 33-17]